MLKGWTVTADVCLTDFVTGSQFPYLFCLFIYSIVGQKTACLVVKH